MYFSLCFLLTLASYGFSGVQSNAALRFPGGADDYGTFHLSGKDNNAFAYGYLPSIPDFEGNIKPISHKPFHEDAANKPPVTFFTGALVGFMGTMPKSAGISQLLSNSQKSSRGESNDNLKKFNDQLKATLNAMDDLEKDVKAQRSKSSNRFMQYN